MDTNYRRCISAASACPSVSGEVAVLLTVIGVSKSTNIHCMKLI